MSASAGTRYEVMFSFALADLESWIVYGLCDPLEPDRVRYVGATKQPLRRYTDHVCGSSHGVALASWIRGLKDEGRLPTMVILADAVGKSDALGAEEKWIRGLRSSNGEADLNVIWGTDAKPAARRELPTKSTTKSPIYGDCPPQ